MTDPITPEEVDDYQGHNIEYWFLLIMELVQIGQVDLIPQLIERCRNDAVKRYINNQTKH